MSIKTLIEKIRQLDSQDVEHVEKYVSNVLRYTNQVNMKEEQCIKELGYNPTSIIEDHEWEAMQKRNQMSLEKESK